MNHEENSAKIIEISVTKDDLIELIKYYQNKTDRINRTSNDRFMIAQLEVALENFKTEDKIQGPI